MANETLLHCAHCGRPTWQSLPGYVCTVCRRSNAPGGEAGAFGCGLAGCAIWVFLVFAAFLAINSLLLIPTLVVHPWGPAGSILLVAWLWKRDNLGAEPLLLRLGVSGFLVIFIGLLLIAITAEIFQLHFIATGKELLLVTAPGALFGFLATKFVDRWNGKLWPVFVGICLAQTIGKATILGWLMGRF